jgi:23S rRNA pseudouridine2605 synthase
VPARAIHRFTVISFHMSERLHKLLARHGLGSRREIEKWMLAGRVLLNNRPAQPGDHYDSGDKVVIDGKDVSARLKVTAAPGVLLYHKPQGQPIAPGAADDVEAAAEKSVMESLPAVRGARWLVVNTMQAGDSGLLLLTSDGRLADALRRRAETTPAAYVARVLVPMPDFDVESIPRVVQYDDETIEFESIEAAGGEGTNRWFRVESHRSHRRAAVRALFESRGLKVSRVIQVKFGDFELPRDLPRGRHRALTDKQVAALYASVDLPLSVAAPEKAEANAARHRRRPPPDRRKKKKGS